MAAAAADVRNSVPGSETEQHTAPAGWTKKLVPTKGKYMTLRKHDVVFIAPDGQEIPSLWHLRRYLKAHPEGPAVSEFNWSSGEESIRRSARASTKEVSYSEKRTPRGKSKRNAAEMDAEGEEEDKVKTPARKRAKKAGKEDSSIVKDKEVLPDKDEVMHEVPEGAEPDGVADAKEAVLGTAVQKDEVDTGTGNVMDTANEEQVAAETAVNAAGGGIHEEQKVEEVTAQGEEVTEHVVVVMKQVIEVKEQVVEVQEQVEEVVMTSIEPQEEVESEGASEVSPLVVPNNELKSEEPVVESEKPLESSDASVVESKEPLDQNLEVREDVQDVPEERHEGGKGSLEPLMQKEEQERLPSVNNVPLKVEHIKEKSPNELSSSPVPVSVANQ
ncbi:hypothetical protein GOP47_0019709 [Adiantum capillus-veneris]|uniref:MBD domain-containing protein n=1 Tax=Adiantum capillus-veneris TaxID=13818 RepID=A0A9D4UBJ8_ADICA|nr:hypothetical protein GOP47_0019709 [Adiantum capillus-veneris]